MTWERGRPARFIVVIATILLTTYGALSFPAFSQNDSFIQNRINSATQIIQEQKALVSKMRSLHSQAHTQILEAKRLQGQAQYLHSKLTTPLSTPKLSGKQLQQANTQYQVDLSSFKQHANAYTQHCQNFKTQVGECHANQKAYQNITAQYQLHCKQFHMPNIEPPHICGVLQLTQEQMKNLSFLMNNDLRQMSNAQQDLSKAEAQLNHAMSQTPELAAQAVSRAQRQQQEQMLATEFGRLKQEYDLLQIEKQQINGSQPSLASHKSVSGKMITSHRR